jgi:hypothetical protein
MTAAAEILDRLAAIGTSVRVEGDRVILVAGSVPLPAELVAAVRERKAELLVMLEPKPGAVAQRQDAAADRIADLTRLDAEPTPEEAAAFRAAALEFFAALDAGHARHVDAVIDAAYAAADAELAGDSAAAGRHRAYADALYRGREVPGPDWWTLPPPSSDLPSLPPVDRPVPAGRWFRITYRTVSGADEALYWFPDAPGGAFLDQCLRPLEPSADVRWFVEEIEPAA